MARRAQSGQEGADETEYRAARGRRMIRAPSSRDEPKQRGEDCSVRRALSVHGGRGRRVTGEVPGVERPVGLPERPRGHPVVMRVTSYHKDTE